MRTEIIRHRDDIPIADLAAVYAHWRERCEQRFAPAWPEIDMTALPPTILPRCLVVDVVDGGKDFTFRYWGTGFTEIHGYDFTGKAVSALPLPGAADTLRRQYLETVAARRALLHHNRLATEKGIVIRNLSLRLPLSADGETVDMIFISVHSESDAGAWDSVDWGLSGKVTSYVD